MTSLIHPVVKGEVDTSHRTILYVEKINVSFDGFKVLNNLSLYIDEGELRCIIGPNGAGKTTLMDVISGKIRPDDGQVFLGQPLDLTTMSVAEIALSGIGRKFQTPTVFPHHSVLANLELALHGPKGVLANLLASVKGEDRSLLTEALELTGLKELRHQPAGLLSHGQKQWLEIGMLVVQKPKVLLVDAPVAGMTPEECERTAELLTSLAGRQSIVVIEHDMDFVRSIAQQVTVLHEGSVLSHGRMQDVQEDPNVIEVYLGEPLC